MIDLFIILASFGISLGLTFQVRKMLLARAVLDQPNERSSHREPVPRGGGWALLAVLLPGMAITEFMYNLNLGLTFGVILLALISWHDDRKSLSPPIRLGAHIAAAWLGSLSFDAPTLSGMLPFLAAPAPPGMIFGGALPFWLDRALMIIGWAWFLNLYNFMDGIDGITCTETIAIAIGVCLLLTATNINDTFLNTLPLLLTGACLGFLALNWHPAKMFMGDVGSVPLGFLTGYMLLALAVKGYFIPALILPLYYLADSGITITKRALRGEKIWQAHRQHFYQHAALATGRHDKVVYWIALADMALIGAALVAVTNPLIGLSGALLIVAILLGKMHNCWVLSEK